MPHSCERELEAEKKTTPRLSDFRAQEGDRWTCSCGKVYVHVCSEAEGCWWEPVKGARLSRK